METQWAVCVFHLRLQPPGKLGPLFKTIPACRLDVISGAFTLSDNLFKQLTSSMLDGLH